VISDGELKRRVEAAIGAHPAIETAHIAVKASGGVVMLAGFVRSYGQKALAEFEPERVPGVLGVADDIDVRLPEVDRRPNPDIALDAVAAIRKYLPPAAEHITVTVRDGSIVLEGVVEWNTERQQAENAVLWVQGVTNVRNLIHPVQRPGSPMPANEHLPLAYIQQPAPVPCSPARHEHRNGSSTSIRKTRRYSTILWDGRVAEIHSLLSNLYASLSDSLSSMDGTTCSRCRPCAASGRRVTPTIQIRSAQLRCGAASLAA
jgi:hypothetical protein